jgi:SAM-dependent methyltransferase
MRTPFQDAALYDWEYRRRRDDVRFYRTLADERGGPVLDLGCGTGRLMVPLLHDGHVVVGIDRTLAMLDRARTRIARLQPALRRRALLMRGDLGAFAVRRRFRFAVAAFHTIQHLETDEELRRFFRRAAGALLPGGWLAFDTFAPNAGLLARTAAPARRWGKTTFRHPQSGERLVYQESFRREGRVLVMTFHHQPVDARGRARGRERRVVLRHRLFTPAEIARALRAARLRPIASWGGFDGQSLDAETEQQVFLARAPGWEPAK